jgi:hypothetical protein
MVMLMPPHFVNGLFNVIRPDFENEYLSRKLRGFKLQRGNSQGLSPPISAKIQGLKGSVEGEEEWYHLPY